MAKETKVNQEGAVDPKVVGTVPGGAVTPPVEPKPPKEPKKDTIEVDKDVLKALLDRETKRDDLIAAQNKKIEMLLEVADKARLANWERNNNENGIIRNAKLTVWENKIVLGWQMVIDEVGFVDGKLIEKQVIRLWLDQGVGVEPITVDVNYLDFARHLRKAEGEIVKQSKGKDSESYTVQMKDGRQFEVDIRFIN